MNSIFSLFSRFGTPETRFVLIDNIEDDWTDLSPPTSQAIVPSSQAIVPCVGKATEQPTIASLFQNTVYTVEEPDDEEKMIVLYQQVKPLSSLLVEEIDEQTEELALQNGPVVQDLDGGDILPAPQKRRGITAPILTTALVAGAAAQTAGVGGLVLETAVGTYFMSTMVSPASWAVTRYFAARAAQAAAAKVLATTVMGVSLPVVANVGFAVVTAVSVAHIGIVVYNRLTTEENRIESRGTTSIVASRFLGIENKKQ